ncbi:MAG TPA: DUF2244 domain-containing protein [Steroidobacteraceae bacterium]|nr:DUF2244 domain-containing protein [Steroidobacteraceae bacterium]
MITEATTSAPEHGIDSRSEPGLLIELAPNCSMTPEGALVFVGAVAAATFGVAAFFTAQGFWPVLPFAGLEVGLLAWAVRRSMRHGQRRERIRIDGSSIIVESTDPAGNEPVVFPRHWARVKLHGPRAASHPSRLTIESHGRVREVGRFLTEDQRRTLASRLKQLVGNVNESPSLG